jgi:hypothetical protein
MLGAGAVRALISSEADAITIARMRTVSVDDSGTSQTFDLDFDDMTWYCAMPIAEAAFPLVAEVDGKRYELYSDGTFDEEKLA